MSNENNVVVHLYSPEYYTIVNNAKDLLSELKYQYRVKLTPHKNRWIINKLESILERILTGSTVEKERRTFDQLNELARTYINNQIKYTLLESSIVKK